MLALEYLDEHAERHPDAEFATSARGKLTYSEARDAANRVACRLIAAGMKPGDRISTIMKNSLDMIIIYFGAFKAGVVPAPVNHRLMPREWREICDDAESQLLFCDQEFAHDVESFRRELSTVRECIVCGDSLSGWSRFEDWIGHDGTDSPEVSLSGSDVALQLYTSGTTGKPRGVLVTYHAIAACIAQLDQAMQFRLTDRFLMVMPLCHAAGIITMLQAVAGRASLLVQSRFVPADVVDALDEQDVTVAMMAPTMIQTCLTDAANFSDRRFENLRLIIYGGSPMAEAALREAMERFHCDFAQRYGSTETLCLAWLSPEDHHLALQARPELLRSAGRPLPGVKMRVIDGDRHELLPRQHGEFIAAGPQLMKRYAKLHEDDVVFEIEGERFICTGDCGFIDADNYLFISDRAHDVIISGGENIYPREIEDVLVAHPDVDQAAVIGVPDEKWGQAVKAIVVRRTGTRVSADEMIHHCRQHVAGFKAPRSVDFVADLPRNAAGKILRYRLRERY